MSSTTVHSNNKDDKYTDGVAGSIFEVTEKTLQVPPEEKVYEGISSYIDEIGNMEIPVGKSQVNENSILVTQDGTTVAMANSKAYNNLVANRRRKAEMKAKAESKSNREQTGMGRD